MARNTISSLITGPVGAGPKATNNPKDVKIIEYLFNIITPAPPIFPENGFCSQNVIAAIKHFQSQELKYPNPDGRVDPAGKSLKALIERARAKRPARTDLNSASRPQLFGGAWSGDISGEISGVMSFLGLIAAPLLAPASPGQPHRAVVDSYLALRGQVATAQENQLKSAVVSAGATGAKLTSKDYQEAASALGDGISVAIIQAFAEVESGGRSGFGSAGLPVIAFEGHVFRRYSGQKYDQSHPKLSYAFVVKAGPEWRENNHNQETAWKTLRAAMELDPAAAVQACSWGMFQVMGFNYKKCGYTSVDDFVAAMKASERAQLDAFVSFCKSTPGMVAAIKGKDFAKMATLYNGKNYGNYDDKISKAYKKHGGI